MATTIADSFDIRAKLDALGCRSPTGFALLPSNLESAHAIDDLRQQSEGATVRTLFRVAGVPLDDLFKEHRPPIAQNNDIHWVAPTLFVAAGVLSEHPNLVSVAYGVITNYLTDFFKGDQGAATGVKVSAIVEVTPRRSYRELTYEGPISGLADFAKVVESTRDERP